MDSGPRLPVWPAALSFKDYPQGTATVFTWHPEKSAAARETCPELAERKSCQLGFVPNPLLSGVQSTEEVQAEVLNPQFPVLS